METMTTSIILPFLVFFPFLGAVISYIIGRSNKGARDIWCWILSAVIFIASLTLIGKETVYSLRGFCGLGLSFAADGFGVILAVLTGAIWLITTIFSKEYMAAERNRNRYYFFVFLTLGATMGIFLSADLFTTFIFFEIMSFTSFVLVMHDEEDFTVRSAKTYLAVAVLGGLVTLMGLFMMYQKAGTLNMAELTAFMQSQENPADFYVIGVLILFGFAAKAGLFPLHIWLPNAYTVAPAPSSALLSCLLTKTGVFGTIIVSCKLFLHDAAWGQFILILGIITMVLGAVLAVFSVNLKRTLACSSMSQIGFIIIAIGMQGLLGEHNALAASGTLLHFLNHSLFKLLLFLGAGVIFMNRRLTGQIASFHFAPTARNAENLRREGVEGSIWITGNTVIDWIVLRSSGKYLNHPLNLFIPADHRIQLLVSGPLYQVIAIFLQRIISSLWVITDHSLITSDRGKCLQKALSGDTILLKQFFQRLVRLF